ncbi:hypothetical protein [Halopseudomonas salegens]|uniref:Uncharacterized protein n=1 Tax=Halopseudomonas salegens TaxID=1434072 RepID=A0A1H2EYQ1_9GAMM|nr:hypothetical protein [Halopseudomonas salegens]SDU00266.1 hypothetical protein SAMN05216210_1151 [Halopseudomonas salegens]
MTTTRHLPANDSSLAQTEAFEWNRDSQLLGAVNTTLDIHIERHYNKLCQLTLEDQTAGAGRTATRTMPAPV